jgi:protein-tyrosine phosphatase
MRRGLARGMGLWGRVPVKIPRPIPHSVLFVCLGNICRSPLAEAAFRLEAERIGLAAEVASAGTGGWHVGEPPDRRAQAVARCNGVDIAAYRGRQVTREDFYRFDVILALDRENLKALRALMPANGTATVDLLLDEVPGRQGEAVADPYYGDAAGFDVTWADVTLAARHLARRLKETR